MNGADRAVGVAAGPRLVQNFRGSRAVIVSAPADAAGVLAATLSRLGLAVERAAHPDDLPALSPEHDVVLVDGDLALAPNAGLAALPTPVVGLVGVGAPGRLRLLLQLGATAFLHKPVHAASVYSALFLAVNEHRRRRHLASLVQEHERRRRGRRHVTKAVLRLMGEHGLDDDAAYEALRRASMKARRGVEEFCEALVAGADPAASILEGVRDDARLLGGRGVRLDARPDLGRDGPSRDAGPGGRPDQTRRA